MNNIKNTFSIHDFELLTGIKAHTIRIWEKRYAILNPSRQNRNVRFYNLNDLQKILNLSLLYNQGFKISKIAKLSDEELNKTVSDTNLKDVSHCHIINNMIVAMYTYDEAKFDENYTLQIEKMTFKELFINTFIPLFEHIGILWQTDSLKPANEHFISNLITQKIILNIASLDIEKIEGPVNIIFLPEQEIHEIGLLFLYYDLKLRHKNVIYLGKSIPFDNLLDLNNQYDNINWISAFTIDKPKEAKEKILEQYNELIHDNENTFQLIGHIWSSYAKTNTNERLHFFNNIRDIIPLL
jgi:MerR family transcriptional regulator, light-induced transcriptional regulator